MNGAGYSHSHDAPHNRRRRNRRISSLSPVRQRSRKSDSALPSANVHARLHMQIGSVCAKGQPCLELAQAARLYLARHVERARANKQRNVRQAARKRLMQFCRCLRAIWWRCTVPPLAARRGSCFAHGTLLHCWARRWGTVSHSGMESSRIGQTRHGHDTESGVSVSCLA